MSTFRVPVVTVESVIDHPQADRLSLVRVRGYECVVAKRKDGSHRHAAGDRVLYVPVGGELPEAILRDQGFWRDGAGTLFGERRNRVSAIELCGRLSLGLLLPLPEGAAGAEPGECFADRLGITKYVPEVPPNLLGQVAVRMEAKTPYAIEHLLTYPTLLAGDEVVVTEKVHGVCSKVSYVPGLDDPGMFGDGCVTVTSKGLGDLGLVFVDVPANADNPYVRTALDHGLPASLRRWGDANAPGERVTLVSEVYGPGIQDLRYGLAAPALRAIDVQVGNAWLGENAKASAFHALGIDRVPVLYRGPFDRAVIDGLYAGMSTLDPSGTIKEGVVVTAVGPQDSRRTDLRTFTRPCLKYHSPAYDRRPDGTEHG